MKKPNSTPAKKTTTLTFSAPGDNLSMRAEVDTALWDSCNRAAAKRGVSINQFVESAFKRGMAADQATRSPAKAARSVTLAVSLTPEQFARMQTIAGLLSSTPEDALLSFALSAVDGCSDDWAEWEEWLCDTVEFYAENGNASKEDVGERLEDKAPERRRRLVARN